MNLRRIIIVAIVGFGLLVVGFIIYGLIPRATIVFSVAPDEMTVIINGSSQTVKTGQEITVTPGSFTVELRRDEFDSHTETFDIKNGERKEILIALNPLTDAARSLLRSDKSQLIIQRIGGAKVEAGGKEITTAYPILRILPINDKFYTIRPCSSEKFPDDTSKIAVCVNLYDLAAKQSAIDNITRLGFKIEDYEVLFVDATYTARNNQAGE